MTQENGFVPNSFQTPNIFVDRLMPLLEPSEFIVLMFATRHILGWDDVRDRRANMSLTAFEKGHRGQPGCGLGRPAIQEALKRLEDFGLLRRVGKPSSTKGQLWELALEESAVQWSALKGRRAEKQAANQKRTKTARKTKQSKSTSAASSVCQTDQPSGMSDKPMATDSSMSDKPGAVCPTYPLKHSIETQKQQQQLSSTNESEYQDLVKEAAASAGSEDPCPPDCDRPNAFALFEDNIALLTPIFADDLGALLDEFPESWVENAIKEGARNGAKTVKYIKRVLERWRKDGPPSELAPAPKVYEGRGSSVPPPGWKPGEFLYVVPDIPLEEEWDRGS